MEMAEQEKHKAMGEGVRGSSLMRPPISGHTEGQMTKPIHVVDTTTRQCVFKEPVQQM